MSVLTFVFTDIEGSTRRWEADAAAMQVALETHNQVLRVAVDANDGRVFNYTGDGVCAVFASPRAAVEAAIAAQLALELPVRMGIATGEAELRGADYFGTVLNRTARVMAAGHGGQILLDGATAGLLSGIDLIPLGPRRLRDIAKAVDVFQVQADGLRTDFPPLKTADRAPGNLRPPTTSFVGREPELADLETALKAHRMVTLTGVGGVGKTRLALEVSARSVDNFPDGVFVIELAAVGDPAAVPEAVAAVLGVTQQPGLTVADSVAAALEGRSRLLVFDNCEHVLDAAADMIEAILSTSSTVKVLATSREGLRLADEQLWPVPSLVNTGVDSAAASLFVERAQAVAPTISLSAPSDAGAVVEICRRLDGIPLGIELAASRLQSMTVTDVRDRLDDRFRLLVGSRRGLERHQTLRHAVQWSFDLLEDDEKLMLARCSVFAGGFDLDGVRAVTGFDDEFATLDLLDALTRKSLVVADRSSAHARFSMLETIRQFAEDQLVQSGRADDARSAHARYFAGREADVLALWDSPRQREAYEWLILELPNLRSAFRWAADTGDLDTAGTIAYYTSFLGNWLQQYEAATWAEELIGPAKAADHQRLAQLYLQAAYCYAAGRTDDAIGYFEAGRAALANGGCDEVPFDGVALIAGLYLWAGRPDRWAELCRETISSNPHCRISTRACLALALINSDARAQAIPATDGLLAAAEATANPCEKVWALMAYGMVIGDPRNVDIPARPSIQATTTAFSVLIRAHAIAQESGNSQLETHAAAALAVQTAARGNPVDALELFTRAIRNYYDSGTFSHMHTPLAWLATYLGEFGHHEPAAIIVGFTADLFTQTTYARIAKTATLLRDALGDDTYESLTRTGESMSNAEMASYALEQIDVVRAQLSQPGEPR
jgi:predicted ATPase